MSQSNNMMFFITSGAGNKVITDEYSRRFKSTQLDGRVYVQDKTGLSFYIINNKTEVFNFITKEHDLEKEQLFAIGNSKHDLQMLFKCIELGGASSLINHHLYKPNNFDTESIVKKIVSLNFDVMIEELTIYPTFNDYYCKVLKR